MANRKLKVLMLGWEFPPHISGGLGTACLGLTQALTDWPVEIHFFLPQIFGQEHSNHLNLYSMTQALIKRKELGVSSYTDELITETSEDLLVDQRLSQLIIRGIPSFLTPYLRPESVINITENKFMFKEYHSHCNKTFVTKEFIDCVEKSNLPRRQESASHYGDKLFEEVKGFALRAFHLSKDINFDIVHAHDWMTYPAASAIGKAHGKPVVLHVHSLESDRSGEHRNSEIAEIERSALQNVEAIIAVSNYTKNRICHDYNVSPEKISVVHNGIVSKPLPTKFKFKSLEKKRQRVLFLGRVTFQKGPDYFVAAALKLLKVLPNTEFVLAGTGDMLTSLEKKIQSSGAASNFIFPGFLRGCDVDEMFSTADLYVMPSVSEPFGISALEALDNNVPIIVSRQSGVSEVIRHALKVDFWDIDELTDLMIGALKYPELRMDLLEMAKKEVTKLNWKASAVKVFHLYQNVLTDRSC